MRPAAMRRAAVSAALFISLSAVLNAQAPGPAKDTLRILRPIVSDSEDGPPLQGGEALQPGEQGFFSFQVENYKVTDDSKVKLTAHVQAFDPRGTQIAPLDEEVIGTSLRDEDKGWKPKFRSQIQIPPIAPPGTYTVRFEVADLQSDQKASGELTFRVQGRAVEPSSALVIRNFGFYRSQDDTTPLKVVAYRAGDILWVRFDMTGYKYGEQNSIDVSYDVTVLLGDGKQLFSQEDAAVEKSQAFYPQPWIPAEFNLSLQSTMTLGTYTLVITARDAIGNQTATAKADFRVE